MALIIDDSIVIEEIKNKDGKLLGKIKFDPNDEKIMKSMSDIVRDLSNKLEQLKKIGKAKEISEKEIETLEDFEKERENIKKINDSIDLEYEAVKNAINSFTEIFGKETMDIITNGSVSYKNIEPLIIFLKPYIAKARKGKVEGYLNAKDSSIFE